PSGYARRCVRRGRGQSADRRQPGPRRGPGRSGPAGRTALSKYGPAFCCPRGQRRPWSSQAVLNGEERGELTQVRHDGPVVHPSAAALALDEAGFAQGLEVVGDRGAGDVEVVAGEVTNADLTLGRGR